MKLIVTLIFGCIYAAFISYFGYELGELIDTVELEQLKMYSFLLISFPFCGGIILSGLHWFCMFLCDKY